jgi:Ca-activated chloride channel family protein
VNLHFHRPWVLLLLIPVLFSFYRVLTRGRTGAVTWSSTGSLAALPVTARTRLALLPVYLRAAALVLITAGLAGPWAGRNPVRSVTEGVAIQMVLDRSGSMKTQTLYQGEWYSRFDIVQNVFIDFLKGDGREMAGRPDDLVGIVVFAGTARTISPLTHSHDALIKLMHEHYVPDNPGGFGTAIGDGIALGAARLRTAEESLLVSGRDEKPFHITSKVMILLTDGEHNAGERTPYQGAALARKWDIKIHAIGIVPPVNQNDLSANTMSERSEHMLTSIVSSTGGIYRTAYDENSLRAVYEEIDRLEKTRIESVQYLDRQEHFLPFAFSALVLLTAEIILSGTVLRRLP